MIPDASALKQLEGFFDPPSTFRPWPFFVLNDEYTPGQGEARLTEFLENLARVGYGGAFLHPRPGLITEYLSSRWFEVIRHCIAECRRLGLVPALYDENSYPSGFAGGHVPALAPQTSVRYVTPKFGTMPASPPQDALAIYLTKEGVPTTQVQPGELGDKASWCAFVMEKMQPMAWHGEFAYTSLLDPETTRTFLETTHQRYLEELGPEDWSTCAAMFTDEPHLTADSHGPWGRGQHFSRLVQSEFQRRRGYGIETALADLYYDLPGCAATRFDFYETLHELWMENFALPLERWCQDHRIPLTGHYLEHDWPCPYATPGHVHLLAHMDWPGTDLLECFALEGHDYPDPQNLDPARPGTEPHALYFLKQVHSVANQLGKKRVVNETWGAGGHDSTPIDWLRIGRFLAVHGVNLFVPHFSPTTIRGSRKKDHPQFFSEQSPWFDALRPLNDELGRLSWLVARGKMKQRVLVIDPLTTGYCLSSKSDCLGSADTVHNAVSDPHSIITDTQRSIRPLREAVANFAQGLSDAQVDYDIGDEYVMAESASISGATFLLGEQAYELLVLPPGLQNLRSKTLEQLREFTDRGGKIVGLKPNDPLLDGRPCDWTKDLPVEWAGSGDDLIATIEDRLAPRIRFSRPLPPGVAHQRRECEEGIYYLIVNSSPSDWMGAVSVHEGGVTCLLDPKSGTLREFNGDLTLRAGEASILLVGKPELGMPPLTTPVPVVAASAENSSVVEFLEAVALDPNVLVIDTCALDVGGESYPRQLVYESNRIYWQRHGMETNGWTSVIQYRDQVLAANRRMPPDSGGIARYFVLVEPDTDIAGTDLCFECPDLWSVRINDRPVETFSLPTWMDCRIGRVQIGHLLQEGANTIELVAAPFDVRQEIDQIYLLGNFLVTPTAPGFVLAPAKAGIALGSWSSQGLPFYDQKVTYRFRRPVGAGTLILNKSDWHGSVLEVTCGERHLQTYGPGLEMTFHENDPAEFSMTITGLPFNLLGPFHKPGFIPKRGWSNFWCGPDIPKEPQPGSAYYHLDLGLFRSPKMTTIPPSKT